MKTTFCWGIFLAVAPLLLPSLMMGCSHGAGSGAAFQMDDLDQRVSGKDDHFIRNGQDVESFFRDAGLKFNTLKKGQSWSALFQGKRKPVWSLRVFLDEANIIIIVPVLQVPLGMTSTDFFLYLLHKNFELNRVKLGIDPSGSLVLSMELPARLVDKRVFLGSILGLVQWVDENYPEIQVRMDAIKQSYERE